MKDNCDLPEFCWSRRADQEYPDVRDQNLRPSLGQVVHLAPLALRYGLHCAGKLLKGRKPPIDQVRMKTGKCIYGVPCGGIGAGTIGRGFRGEFTRFQVVPGMYKYETVWADAFHLVVRDKEGGAVVFYSVLGSKRSRKGGRHKGSLSKWEYNIRDENISYHALYPQSWMVFDVSEVSLKLTCHQISPFLPHCYEESCLPATVFEWKVENYGGEDRHVTIAFSFKNGWGWKKDHELEPSTRTFSENDFPSMRGRQMDQKFRGLGLSYAIGAEVSDDITTEVMPDFDPNSDGSAFRESLLLDGEKGRNSSPCTATSKNIAMAVNAFALVPRGSSKKFKFGLVWDMPKIKFRGGAKVHTRFYTREFSKKSGDIDLTAQNILWHSFTNCRRWVDVINDWQRSILSDQGLPDWFKSAIFNEMYYIADGGSQWLRYEKEGENDDDPRRKFGRFAYLESHEYRLFNTYDVHFYASFALMALFPGLQLALQADFCDATERLDDTRITELYGGHKVARSPAFSVPHDLGDPDDEPFVKVNAYRIHDVSAWKDLNLKFVISIWRDIKWAEQSENADLRKSALYLRQRCWPICVQLMEFVGKWDRDWDGLIENDGLPDQTYDSWVMTGPGAYCNSLWIAALNCMIQFASSCSEEDEQTTEKYQMQLDKARDAFHSKLWIDDGKFFCFDATEKGRNTVMSDQLCGAWYLYFCCDTEVFDEEKVSAALDTIFNYNVMKVADGKSGAMNGMLFKEAKVDRSTVQSEEIWTGVSYALASLMISRGKIVEGFRTAEGIYRTVYESIGMGFETPEALYEHRHYRAIGYMRPLSIWSVYEAWRKRMK